MATQVYQVSSRRSVWAGVSWAFLSDDTEAMIDDVSETIANNMIEAVEQIRRLQAEGIDVFASPDRLQ